jgi:hypothetical protein
MPSRGPGHCSAAKRQRSIDGKKQESLDFADGQVQRRQHSAELFGFIPLDPLTR